MWRHFSLDHQGCLQGTIWIVLTHLTLEAVVAVTEKAGLAVLTPNPGARAERSRRAQGPHPSECACPDDVCHRDKGFLFRQLATHRGDGRAGWASGPRQAVLKAPVLVLERMTNAGESSPVVRFQACRWRTRLTGSVTIVSFAFLTLFFIWF